MRGTKEAFSSTEESLDLLWPPPEERSRGHRTARSQSDRTKAGETEAAANADLCGVLSNLFFSVLFTLFLGAVKMAQCWRTLVALLHDPSSVPSTQVGQLTSICRQLLRFLQAPALKHTSPLAETHLHIIKRFERILYLVTCTCVYRSANLCTWIQYMQKPEKGIGICGTGVTTVCAIFSASCWVLIVVMAQELWYAKQAQLKSLVCIIFSSTKKEAVAKHWSHLSNW